MKPNKEELLWNTPAMPVELIVYAFVMVVDGNEEEIDKESQFPVVLWFDAHAAAEAGFIFEKPNGKIEATRTERNKLDVICCIQLPNSFLKG